MSIKEDIVSAFNKLVNAGEEWDKKYPSVNVKKYLKTIPDLVNKLVDYVLNEVNGIYFSKFFLVVLKISE